LKQGSFKIVACNKKTVARSGGLSSFGIKAASIYHHFPSKADLGAAVARRYWQDAAANIESMLAETPDPAC
jgi:hypothetical protein